MTPGYAIALVGDRDAPLVDQMHRVGFPKHPVYGMPDYSLWWVVKGPKGIPAAMCGLKYDTVSGQGYLCRSVVLPANRGHGLQRMMIKARLKKAKALGLREVVTDTIDNTISANHLIDEGFKLYEPAAEWGNPGALYWRKVL